MRSFLKISAILLALVIIGGAGMSFTTKSITPKPEGGIKWLSITEAEKQNAKKKKKIFVDIYTEWCGWCKRLDATTYKDPAVVKYINDNFYAVKLDAETKDTISFKGVKYSYDPSYKINMVSPYFMGGSSGYPTLTYLDENMKVLRIAPGYVSAPDILNQLKFVGENYYLNMSYEKYSAQASK